LSLRDPNFMPAPTPPFGHGQLQHFPLHHHLLPHQHNGVSQVITAPAQMQVGDIKMSYQFVMS
jgi:hypothetical protein